MPESVCISVCVYLRGPKYRAQNINTPFSYPINTKSETIYNHLKRYMRFQWWCIYILFFSSLIIRHLLQMLSFRSYARCKKNGVTKNGDGGSDRSIRWRYQSTIAGFPLAFDYLNASSQPASAHDFWFPVRACARAFGVRTRAPIPLIYCPKCWLATSFSLFFAIFLRVSAIFQQ